jgi:hypothetical protein
MYTCLLLIYYVYQLAEKNDKRHSITVWSCCAAVWLWTCGCIAFQPGHIYTENRTTNRTEQKPNRKVGFSVVRFGFLICELRCSALGSVSSCSQTELPRNRLLLWTPRSSQAEYSSQPTNPVTAHHTPSPSPVLIPAPRPALTRHGESETRWAAAPAPLSPNPNSIGLSLGGAPDGR